GSEELEKTFAKEATAAGLDGLKGHRSVGGMRASIYNAFPEAGVDALVQFMKEFERRNGERRERARRASHVSVARRRSGGRRGRVWGSLRGEAPQLTTTRSCSS